MRITKLVDMKAEVDVDISVDDIAAAISEDPNSLNAVLRGLNNSASFMKAIPNSLIAEMNVQQRNVIGGFLFEQTARFLPQSTHRDIEAGTLSGADISSLPESLFRNNADILALLEATVNKVETMMENAGALAPASKKAVIIRYLFEEALETLIKSQREEQNPKTD